MRNIICGKVITIKMHTHTTKDFARTYLRFTVDYTIFSYKKT